MTETVLAANEQNLVWIDLEMTGLNPNADRIIEMAVIITNGALDVVAEGPVLAVRQSQALLDGMDEWNKRTHGGSGLIERVRNSTLDEPVAERLMLDFIGRYVPAKRPDRFPSLPTPSPADDFPCSPAPSVLACCWYARPSARVLFASTPGCAGLLFEGLSHAFQLSFPSASSSGIGPFHPGLSLP